MKLNRILPGDNMRFFQLNQHLQWPKKLNYVDDQNSAEAWLIIPYALFTHRHIAANRTKMVGYIEYCLFLNSHIVGWKTFEYYLLLDVLNSDIDGYPMAWSTCCYFPRLHECHWNVSYRIIDECIYSIFWQPAKLPEPPWAGDLHFLVPSIPSFDVYIHIYSNVFVLTPKPTCGVELQFPFVWNPHWCCLAPIFVASIMGFGG